MIQIICSLKQLRPNTRSTSVRVLIAKLTWLTLAFIMGEREAAQLRHSLTPEINLPDAEVGDFRRLALDRAHTHSLQGLPDTLVRNASSLRVQAKQTTVIDPDYILLNYCEKVICNKAETMSKQ